jgi:hypothetical protein
MLLKYGGDLYHLLIRCCPPDQDGHKSITRLAGKLSMTDSGVRKWLKDDRMSGARALQVVELAGDPEITVADFDRWVYKS